MKTNPDFPDIVDPTIQYHNGIDFIIYETEKRKHLLTYSRETCQRNVTFKTLFVCTCLNDKVIGLLKL